MGDPLGTLRDFYEEHVKRYGTGLAGAAFGLGWWAWIDAVVTVTAKVPFSLYLPGIAATFALLLINSVRWDEVQGYDPWNDDGVYCRSRVWLLVAYLVAGGSIAGAAAVMIHSGGAALGMACVLQVASIIGAALLFFVSRSEGEGGDGYSTFL